MNLQACKLARMLDHTLLRPEATRAQIEQFLQDALAWNVITACVSPTWLPLAVETLRGSSVKPATVVGFPFGFTLSSVKRAEAVAEIRAGAQELDMVLNIGALKSGDHTRVENDIRGVVEICHAHGVTIKVIFENAYLNDEEKVSACRLAQQAGADFVKTSTGLAASGATEADVQLMRAAVGPTMGVKAAGGIRTLADAQRMIAAGANRLGTSAAVAILRQAKAQNHPA